MRLLSLRFRHVGPFGAEGVALDGLTPGLNVICETNEFGKSTILKALETVLFKPFSSSDRQVKSLMTGGSDLGPAGEIIFEADGKRYHLTKRFLRGKTCELRNGSGTLIASNREADERLAKLLSPEGHDTGPSGLLWVRQGDSMAGVSDDGQVASRLEGELTTLVGGDRAREYLLRVESDLSENLTGTGREKSNGPLKLARDALMATEAALADARQKRDQTHEIGLGLAKVRDELSRLNAGYDAEKTAKEIEETREAMTAARAFVTNLQRLKAERGRVAQLAERAAERQSANIDALTKFHRWTAETAALEKEQTERRAKLAAKVETETALRRDIADLDAQAEKYSAARQAAEATATLKRELEDAGRDAAHLSGLDEAYQEMSARLSHLDHQLTELPTVKRGDIAPLERLVDQSRQLEAERGALSTHIYLDLTEDGAGKVILDGKTLTSGPIKLSGGQALDLAGIGQLRGDDMRLQALERDWREATQSLAAKFERLGVADVREARLMADQRHDLETERKRLVEEMTALAPQGENALQTDLESARHRVDTLTEKLADMPINEAHSLDGEADIRQDFIAARGRLDAVESEIVGLREAQASAKAKLEGLQSNLTALRLPETEADRTVQADNFAAEKLKADSDVRLADAAIEAAELNAPRQSLELLDARLKRLEQMTRQTQATLQDLHRKEASLQANRDAAFEGEDADARVESLEAKREVERDELSRLERRVAAQTVLRDTLQASQSRLREAYTEPVRAELAPLLAMVLPGTEANLNESLGADTVSRGGRIEDIGQLSGGTREQIAILTRLAFARLLKRGGAAAPVILDDALVYADDKRRDDMFDVLNHVSAKSPDGEDGLQLIYLSCHQGATQRLGGHRIIPESWRETG